MSHTGSRTVSQPQTQDTGAQNTRSGQPAPEPVSVLFLHEVSLGEIDEAPRPDHFHDLHIDDVAEAVCGRGAGDLASYFRVPLHDAESVRYRQAAIAEAERPSVRAALDDFVRRYALVGSGVTSLGQLRYRRQRERSLLDTVGQYCDAVQGLHDGLHRVEPESSAWRRLRDHLDELVASDAFRTLQADHERVRAGLDEVVYSLVVHENRIKVDRYEGEADLGAHVVDLFERFREEPVPRPRKTDDLRYGFSHVDAKVLEHVAQLFPSPFGALTEFAQRHHEFLDPVVARLGREAALVLAWVDLGQRLSSTGLPLCYPAIDPDAPFVAQDSYDLALATGLGEHAGSVVTNSICLEGGERQLVVTGPNQGGKTTFARMIGQTHYLAALGFPVAGSAVRTRLVDEVFVHFEREEEVGSERGKLKDDLIRVHDILRRATPDSVVVLNEVFSSTTTADALGLARRVLAQLADTGCLTVCVTFLDELAEPAAATVSLVAGVDPEDPSRRTFEIRRRPADGKAYAAAIAHKYGLARDSIARRVDR